MTVPASPIAPHRIPLRITAAALALAACSSGSDDTPQTADAAGLDIPEVEVPEISLETIREGTRTLSSDEFEGRAPGTQGEEKTVAYLVEEFEKAGLEPGNNGSWVQEVPLVEITGKDYAPLTISGADSGRSNSNTPPTGSA